jgi:hypothetical protein
MAGGSITRICGGNFITELSGGMECFTDTFDVTGGKQNRLGGKEGTVKDKPGKPKSDSKHVIRGWWSSDKEGEKTINEALIGDIVYFHLETKDIPDGDGVFMSLYDDDVKRANEEKDSNKGSDRIVLNKKQDDFEKVKANKIVKAIDLKNFSSWIEEEEDKTIELYFVCSYKGENVELPVQFHDYLKVSKKIEYGGLFMFIITDELLPSGKIVRKVVIPPSNGIWQYFKGNPYERFGMIPTNPFSNITIGEHASGVKPSPFLSGSTLPNGAPNIDGSPQYIDIKKAEAAGCKIHTTEEILKDLKRLQDQAPNLATKNRLQKVINSVEGLEKEVLVKGNVPANAVKSATTMKITKGLRIVNIIGIVITAYELEKATEKSIDQKSFKPIAAETIRQVGRWGAAIAGAKIGAIGGAAIGIETGPGAVMYQMC